MSRPLSENGAALVAGLLADPDLLKASILAERARRSGKRDFATFVKQAWQYVPQVEPLVWNWHMDAVCLHLEAVARGEIPWLAVSIPPGHAKSVFGTILWPAWIWTWWPKCQFIFGSYSHGFVVRDARRCREVIQSDWYQATYCKPAGWTLRDDYGSADNFSNTLGGVRFATSVGGAGAGLRAHVIGIDDPLNIGDAMSKKARDDATAWLSQTLSQRIVAGYDPRVLLIMQRLHEEDPTAWLLRQRNAQVLRLPSEFEPDNRCITYKFTEKRNGHVEIIKEQFWQDPRHEPGELLFEKLFSRQRIDDDKIKLGAWGFASQHQQRPSPDGGGLFPIANWRFWRTDNVTTEKLGYALEGVRPRACYDGPALIVDLTKLDRSLISVDATFKETKSGSYVVIQVWAALGAARLLLYRVRRRMDFTDTVKEMIRVAAIWPEARRKLIEGKANGDAIISTLKNTHGMSGLEAVQVSGDKMKRAMAMQPYQSAANVFLPDGAPWLDEHIDEHSAFPNGANDDQVDAQAQALAGLEGPRSPADRYNDIEL